MEAESLLYLKVLILVVRCSFKPGNTLAFGRESYIKKVVTILATFL